MGIGIVVYGEVRDFLDPENGGGWSDLFVGLGIKWRKPLCPQSLTLAVGAGAIAAPLWMVILMGAGAAIVVGAVINVLDERMRIKENVRASVNAAQARTREGQVVQWQ